MREVGGRGVLHGAHIAITGIVKEHIQAGKSFNVAIKANITDVDRHRETFRDRPAAIAPHIDPSLRSQPDAARVHNFGYKLCSGKPARNLGRIILMLSI